MNENKFPQTFKYHEQPLFDLSGSYSPEQDQLQICLKIQTETFPKFYSKIITSSTLDAQQKVFFHNVEELYNTLEDMENVDVNYQKGIIHISFVFNVNKMKRTKQINIVLERQLESELNEIRKIIQKGSQNSLNAIDFEERVQKLWRRQQENEKIFMKFKEEVQLRIEQLSERMSIQNSRISMMSQQMGDIWDHLGKMTKILCPMLGKINIRQEFIENFLLQNMKIVYIGQPGIWTQIIFKQLVLQHKKYEFNCKILNSKKNNIIIGLTNAKNNFNRSSFKKEKGIIGLSANGIMYENMTTNHSDSSSSDRDKMETSKNSDPMKPMQVIKLVVDSQKKRISWYCGGKQLAQTYLGQFKSEQIVVFIEFCDTGDTVQIL